MRWLIGCAVVLMAAAAHGKIVYETGFENDMQLPPGWVIESHGPGQHWTFGGNPSDWHMRVRVGPGGDQDEWLVSPELDLTAEQGISVEFWQWFRTLGNGVAQVRVSIDGGQTWETVVEYSTDQATTPKLAVPEADGQAHVRFCWRYLASNDYQWDVDDVRVHAEVPVDLQILGARGPTAGDYLRQGADLVARLTFMNLGSQPSPASVIRFVTPQGRASATVPSGIAPDDSLALSFTVSGVLFSAPGDVDLSVVVTVPGDAVAGNDSLEIAPLHVIDTFPSPATTILTYDDAADSALFAAVLEARGEQYDCWNRRQGGSDRNLYGLEGWRIVVFTETRGYPSRQAQLALMRCLDQPAPGLRRGLVISGDNWLSYAPSGLVLEEFVEDYLGITGGSDITTELPSLYPIPGNTLGIEQILSTNAVRPDVVTPNPATPAAALVLAYDQQLDFGAMGTYHTATYQTLAAGFEWGQLIVHDEQVALASACLDWLLAAAGDRAMGEALRLDLSPNPTTDRLTVQVPGPVWAAGATAGLVDMGGRRAANWHLPGSGLLQLALPRDVSAGAYCLVLAPGTDAQVAERVVVWR